MRLIDADALEQFYECGTDPDDHYADMTYIRAEHIDNAPTIKPEQRHGRWNYRHEDDWCYCTACGTDAEGSDGECLETDYCPHCGALMDGGDDNEHQV